MVTFTLISIFTNFFTCLFVIILLILTARKHVYFILFNINLCIWSFFYILYIVADSEKDALLYARISCASMVLITFLFFRTTISLSNITVKPIYTKINNLSAIILFLLMFTPIMIRGVKPFLNFNFIPDTTIFYALYYIYTIFFVIYGLLLFYRSIKYNYKNKFFFFGYIVGWFGGLTTFLPYLSIPIYPFSNILVSIYTVFITYALLKHRTFDNVMLVSKILSKVLSILLLCVSYIVCSYVYELLEIKNGNFRLVFIFSYILVSFEIYQILCVKLNDFRESKAIGIFYKKSDIINRIQSDILNIVKLDKLYQSLESIIQDKLNIKIKSFYVSSNIYDNNNDSKLKFIKYSGDSLLSRDLKKLLSVIDNNNIILPIKYDELNKDFKDIMDNVGFSGFIPLMFNNKIMGFITLKSRPNKRGYFYYEDMEIFDEIADKAGIALERIRLHLKFLKEKEDSLKSLAASIAHEIRNPLGAIKLTTDNLVSTKENIENKKELQQIVNQDSNFKDIIEKSHNKITNFKNQINKTIDLAGNVIDMTLHELGGKKFTKEDFSYYTAHKIVMDALAIYGYKTNEEKEKVIIDLGHKNITAKNADKEVISVSDIAIDKNSNFLFQIEDTAFKYIIFNLVKNALFYLEDYPDSKVTISFEENKIIDPNLINRFKLNPDIKKYNIVKVTDNGPGIPDKIITKIFDSYFTSGKKGGTGVGLDFCRRVMNDFDGGIICESEVGEYTTFSLLFQILSEDEKKEAVKEITEIEKKKEQALAEGKDLAEIDKLLEKKPVKKILLVDDVKTNIKVLATELKNKCPNLNITIEINPIKAFELIKDKQEEDKQFDLILTDIEMSEMGGVELIAKIRKDLDISKDDLPILAYSSREDKNIISQALAAGCNYYYTKPKELRFIARNISKWVLDKYIPNKNIHEEDIIVNETTLKDLNVIIADDQAVNLMLIAKKFQDAGANVTKCKDGEDIIKLIEDNPIKYHLIFTDINMTRVGGIEAVIAVRKIEKQYNNNHKISHRIPIIAISGDNDKEFVMKMLNNSIDDYMVKGSNPKDMIKLSKFWIDYRFDDNDNDKNKIKSKSKSESESESEFLSIFSDRNEALEMIEAFEEESNEIIKEIRESKTNLSELKKSIHKLKGSSGSMGMKKLFQYMSELNIIIKRGEFPEDKEFDIKIEKVLQEETKQIRDEF